MSIRTTIRKSSRHGNNDKVSDKPTDAELREAAMEQDALMAEFESHQDNMVHQYVTSSLLLEMFDEPIVFHKAFVGITESAVAALFLSYATYTTEKLPNSSEGWFSKTIEEWQKETGLTRFEQTTARRILREKGILIERRVGMPSMLWFKISKETLLDALLAQSNANFAQSDSNWG